MTIEEKAKAYDEALEWMRELYPGLHGATKEDAEHYFPELRESEDERIRKAIIELLKEVGRDDTGISENAKCMIAYLEKQQEQKPNIELIQRSWYMEGYNDRYFFMEPKWILKTGKGGPKYEPNPRYGKSLILGQEPCCCSVNAESEYDKGWRDGHKAGLKDVEMQKPAWSEEDERMLNRIIETLSLPPIYDTKACAKMVSWLKSLRPPFKPSEEQMEALKTILEHEAERTGSSKELEKANALYEQLKKLLS